MQPDLYDPLKRILIYDDFDKSLNGWMALVPNLREDAMEYYPGHEWKTKWGFPMLSSATFAYGGTHGSLNGNYSMKLSTRPVGVPAQEEPKNGSLGVAIKRLTIPLAATLLRFEMWYSIKVEQSRPGIGEQDFRGFGFVWDIQDSQHRYFPGIRYINSANGILQKRWQYSNADAANEADWGNQAQSAKSEPGKTVFIRKGIDPYWLGKRYENGNTDGFVDIESGAQDLCFNESSDKLNWHYLSFTFNIKERKYVELATQDKRFDLSGLGVTLVDPYPRINNLLNPIIWVETDSDRRSFLFIDSIVCSYE
jgi:hypothetical protein